MVGRKDSRQCVFLKGQTRPEENTGDGTAQQKSSQYLQPDSSSHQSARHRLSPGSRRKERSSPATTSNETSSTAKKAPSGSQTNLAVIVTHKYEKQQSSNSPKTTPVLLRKKLHGSTVRLLGEKRRISCKDLGHGDCQGYLYKLKTGVFSRWVKKFCVVKDYHLYLYDTKEDDRAQGIIDLRAFKVSPATENEAKQKKFAFKVYHSGTTFIFASETLEDMRKWMEKMGMSAIGYDMSNVPTLAGFSTQTINEEAAAAYSESDDEETSNHYNDKAEELKSQLQSDPLTAAYSQLRKAAVDFSGTDLKIKRTQTMMQTVRLKSAKNVSTKSKRQVELTLKLGGLERTLKDKEGELQLIEDLLSNKMITGEEIKRLMAKNPRIDKRSKPSKDSNSSSDEDL